MRKLNLINIIVCCAFSFSASAGLQRAKSANDVLNCWDMSYAYTQAVVTPLDGQPNLLQVTLVSHQQDYLKSVVTQDIAAW